MYFDTFANVLWYSCMAGFGRREIEYMQGLCIYYMYIECYSVVTIRGYQEQGILIW